MNEDHAVIAAAEADAAATRLMYLSKRLARELDPEQRQAARVLAAKMGVEMAEEQVVEGVQSKAREMVARMAEKL